MVVVAVGVWWQCGGSCSGCLVQCGCSVSEDVVAVWWYWQWGCGGSVVVVALGVWWQCGHSDSGCVVAVWSQ